MKNPFNYGAHVGEVNQELTLDLIFVLKGNESDIFSAFTTVEGDIVIIFDYEKRKPFTNLKRDEKVRVKVRVKGHTECKFTRNKVTHLEFLELLG